MPLAMMDVVITGLLAFAGNLLGVLVVAPLGALIIGWIGFIFKPWREAAKDILNLALFFAFLGAVAALPSLLTGQVYYLNNDCPGRTYGYSCY